MRKLLRFLSIALAGVTATALIGVLYQTISTERDRRTYPPPGRLIDVGGYRLHLYCTGKGSPTVVLLGASFDTVSDWNWVQPKIAQVTQVCAFDRAGIGWSDLGPGPHDPQTNARELHAALEKEGVDGPLILVGHSFGGLYSRYYAAMYPHDVAGNVLIEATSPDFLRRTGKPEVMPNADPRMVNMGPVAARLGILRSLQFAPVADTLPEKQREGLRAYYSTAKFADCAWSTFRDFPKTLAEVRATGSLGTTPLVIVVGSGSENSSGILFELQKELAALSTDTVIRIVDGADHMSLVHSERYSQGTVDAILEVIESARKHEPLRQSNTERQGIAGPPHSRLVDPAAVRKATPTTGIIPEQTEKAKVLEIHLC
jgi:pimeloyl-ACP methyl ester carboxylesterase